MGRRKEGAASAALAVSDSKYILARWIICSSKTSRHFLTNSSGSLIMSRWLLQAWLRCTVPSSMMALMWL